MAESKSRRDGAAARELGPEEAMDAMREVVALNRLINRARTKAAISAKVAKEDRKAVEGLQSDLNAMIHRMAEPEAMPLFERPASEAKAPEVGGERGVDDWRGVNLSAPLGVPLADRLWEAGEFQTVGDVAAFFGDDAEADLGSLELSEEEVAATLAGLKRFRSERGGAVLAEFPEAWLVARLPEAEAEPAKPAKKPKGKAKAGVASAWD